LDVDKRALLTIKNRRKLEWTATESSPAPRAARLPAKTLNGIGS